MTTDHDSEQLRRQLESAVEGTVAFDAGTRALYTMDASNYRRVPTGVVVPRTADDVVAGVAAAREHGAPLVMRGGGTSIGGQATAEGLVVDTSRHLNEILELDPDRRTARVQPGVVLDDLRAAAAPYGLTFGPDPSTHSRCTLGGMIGNNSCGSHSVAWGTTADNVEELDVLLYDGTRMTVGAAGRAGLDQLAARPDRQGQIHAGLRDLVARNLATIRHFPDFPRRMSGYALDHLLPEHGGHVARALVGTEGTCVTVLGATVRLVETPPARALVVVGFPDDVAAAEAVPRLRELSPLTVEGVDERIVELATRGRPGGAVPRLPDGGAWLLCETSGRDSTEATEAARELARAADAPARVVTDPGEQRTLWRLREEGAGTATRLADGSEAWPGWEDAAVPPQQLGAYLKKFHALLRRHDLHGLTYGHFGEGCIHVRIDFDLVRPAGVAHFRRFVEEAADLVVAHGGSPSGEHGDGIARSELLPRLYGQEGVRAFEEFKQVFDPADRMNPGVLVRPYRIDDKLRFASGDAARELPAVLGYPHDDGSFAQATRRCVGVGKCRNSSGGVMCPSYMVTRDERHSTRGRARLLHEMLNGEIITDGWRSPEVREALDLCLSCKGCRSDCPVGVDMATYKAEFLHHHYAGRLRPAAHYSMGWLPASARLAGLASAAANAAMASPAVAGLLKRVGGIARQRELPRFAPEPFTRWFRRHARARGGGRVRAGGRRAVSAGSASPDTARPPVLLWPDTFTSYFTPEVGRAAVTVLEDAGFRVIAPAGPLCCGLTWISTGQLGVARRVLDRTLDALDPAAAAGTPIVALEPSCAAVFRGDAAEMLPGDPRAGRVAGATRTLAELLTERASGWAPQQVERSAIVQTHCHQHAVLGFDADRELLARAGVDAEVLDSGCCGLAGNFGFEAGHYDVSVACAERVLLPAVRAASPDTLVLADGFSCRTQIAQHSDRKGLHLAQVLAAASPEQEASRDIHWWHGRVE